MAAPSIKELHHDQTHTQPARNRIHLPLRFPRLTQTPRSRRTRPRPLPQPQHAPRRHQTRHAV
ncbi:hypothetical protein DBR18_17030, partial [Pseudomonas sp. HMWF021]